MFIIFVTNLIIKMEKLDFNKDFNFINKHNVSYYAYLNNKEVIFLSYKKYEGIITLQYLENGGITSLIDNKIIIKLKNGYLEISKLKYMNREYSSKEFIKLIGEKNLINNYFK